MRAMFAGMIVVSAAVTAAEPVQWSQGKHLQLMISDDDARSTQVWEVKLFSQPETLNPDIEVISWDPSNGSELRRLIFVEGMFIVSRGEPLEPGREFEPMDEALAMFSLATTLMSNFGSGPSNIYFEALDRYDPYNPIEIPSVLGIRRFEVPWTIKGKVTRGPRDSYRFEMEFKAASETKPLNIVATWHHELEETPVDDGLRLEGWRVHQMDWSNLVSGEALAQLRTDHPATMRGLRRQARAEANRAKRQ